MAAKAIFVICVQALLFKSAISQCFGGIYGAGFAGPYGAGWGFDGLAPFDGLGYGAYGGWPGVGCGGFGPYAAGIAPAAGLAASFGGGLAVTSASPIAPIGLTVTSENVIEGPLAVVGNLPFLGAVATDGAFPTAGAGAVAYGCGDGAVGIAAEGPIAPAAIIAPAAFAPGFGYGAELAPFGYELGLGAPFEAGCGCGCGAVY